MVRQKNLRTGVNNMFKVTADGIMSTFSKAIAKLDLLAEACGNEIDAIAVKAEALELARNDAVKELTKAKRYAMKLRDLYEG